MRFPFVYTTVLQNVILFLSESVQCSIMTTSGARGGACFLCVDQDHSSVICCGYKARDKCNNDFLTFFYRKEWVCESNIMVTNKKKLTNKSEIVATSKENTISQAVQKRAKEDHELATVPWQTLWLLQSSKQQCDFQEAVLRSDSFSKDLQTAEWLRNRPEDPIGHCPVRFRPHVDPHRWLPRNLVISECLCEGTPCARHGLHVCVTAFAARTVYSLYTGKKRILIAVGCLCAVQKARLAQVISPELLD